jgi:hypothetical protein
MNIELSQPDEIRLCSLAKLGFALRLLSTEDPFIFLKYCLDLGGDQILQKAKEMGVAPANLPVTPKPKVVQVHPTPAEEPVEPGLPMRSNLPGTHFS